MYTDNRVGPKRGVSLIENYPYPTDSWGDHWFALLDKYEPVPVEYGHWVDSGIAASPPGRLRSFGWTTHRSMWYCIPIHPKE